jgi:hydroxymethylglutaryl-CoA lyase
MHHIEIRDVAPRDGLQSEAPLAPRQRAELALALAAAGVGHVEAASFVSPRAVPAMASGNEVLAAIGEAGGASASTWWVLVPNPRGAEMALAAGATHLTMTISASDGYSRKNVGKSTDEAIGDLQAIAALVRDRAMLDVVVSCAFGSPFDDVADAGPAQQIAEVVASTMPAARLTLADTTGTATPRRVKGVVDAMPSSTTATLGMHLHDTRGTALANALAALELGVARFDTSTGGLGGSPFAPGAGGNLATEDLILMLHDLGHDTGIYLGAVLAIAARLPDLIGHPVASRTSSAGPLPRFRT